MRILHVNKFLYRRGGAEAYMEDLADLQVAAGHTVAFFGMQHPLNTHLEYQQFFPSHIEMEPPPTTMSGRVRGAARMVYSTSAARGMHAVIDRFEPDVVHLHNIYHQLSPSVLRPVARRHLPAVMTLHDYKLACPTYQFLDHGNICEACLGGKFHNALLRRCKDGSLAASAAAAGELFIHTATRAYAPVRVFVCPSRFLADKMAEAGVFVRRLRHVPHFIDYAPLALKDEPGGGILVAGRLSPEKGVDVAVRAVGMLDGATLDIAGAGPEEARLRALAEQVAPGRVRFHGLLDKPGVDRMMRAASVVVVPSRWYENQPMVVLEALARGVPVVGSALGGLPELIEPGATGDLVPANDPVALAGALAPFLADPGYGMSMRERARQRVASEFSPQRHLERIETAYRDAGVSLRPASAA
ncbi:MAG: glycosyltransferase [Candidatus Dormibacteraeota bacterium]|uniref:Glycosyl transferase n=1 Tax=Candidatus Aeolococcus gillhamiae TaxID=3127015 RepID=A0A2W6AAL0_9BACT|nr:glycosyltransferase [Candidatus Dormibacteraeota bacterium]PZR80544.1 MAG: glycosyl transferase [Candidatus Dormibacter sp. RRmetagenome_bin12]